MLNFDVDDLLAFRAVALCGGITRAAENLNRVQSAVTSRIKGLERRLGVALFIREHRRLTLTPEGNNFLNDACRILELCEQAGSALNRSAPHGRLRIGALESAAAARLPPLLSRYHQLYPEVELSLSTGTTRKLIDSVDKLEIDCAFVAGPLDNGRMDHASLFEEELVLAADSGVARVRSARDIASRSLVAFARGCSYRAQAENWFASSGARPSQILEIESYDAMLACVAAGIGVAMVPRSVILRQNHPEAIKAFRLAPKYARSVTYLIKRPDCNSAAVAAFWRLAAENKKSAAPRKPARI